MVRYATFKINLEEIAIKISINIVVQFLGLTTRKAEPLVQSITRLVGYKNIYSM